MPLQVTKKKDLSDLYRHLYRSRDVQQEKKQPSEQEQQQVEEGGGKEGAAPGVAEQRATDGQGRVGGEEDGRMVVDGGSGGGARKGGDEVERQAGPRALGTGRSEAGMREDELMRVAREAAVVRRLQGGREGERGSSERKGGMGRGDGFSDAHAASTEKAMPEEKGVGADSKAVSELSAGRENLTLRKEAEGLVGSGKRLPEDHGGGTRSQEIDREPDSSSNRSDVLLPPSSQMVPSLGGQKRSAEDRVKSARERFLARKQQRTEPPSA